MRNDRIVAKAAVSRLFCGRRDVADLGASFTDELGRPFAAYNASKNQCFEVCAVGNAARAAVLIEEASR